MGGRSETHRTVPDRSQPRVSRQLGEDTAWATAAWGRGSTSPSGDVGAATVSSAAAVLNDRGMQISASLFGGVLLTCTFALGGCYEPRECDDGTVERDGQCVNAETEAGSSSS